MSFAQSEYAMKKKMTRRERFLGEMEKVVPWERLVEIIKPHYPKGGADGLESGSSGCCGRVLSIPSTPSRTYSNAGRSAAAA